MFVPPKVIKVNFLFPLFLCFHNFFVIAYGPIIFSYRPTLHMDHLLFRWFNFFQKQCRYHCDSGGCYLLFLNSCSTLSIFFSHHATMPHNQVMHVDISYNLCIDLFVQLCHLNTCISIYFTNFCVGIDGLYV